MMIMIPRKMKQIKILQKWYLIMIKEQIKNKLLIKDCLTFIFIYF